MSAMPLKAESKFRALAASDRARATRVPFGSKILPIYFLLSASTPIDNIYSKITSVRSVKSPVSRIGFGCRLIRVSKFVVRKPVHKDPAYGSHHRLNGAGTSNRRPAARRAGC
jgi:hypothetical protein